MSKATIATVYDMVSGLYAAPFFTANKSTAARSFATEVSTGSSQVASNPDDFQLFELGSFDDSTGQIELLPNPVLIVSGSQCKRLTNAMPPEQISNPDNR